MDEGLSLKLRARRREECQRWKAQYRHDLRDAILDMAIRYGSAQHRAGLAFGAGRDDEAEYYERAGSRRFAVIQRLMRNIT